MDPAQIVSVIVAVLGVGGVATILAYFKLKPGERESLDVNVAQANLNIARGTVQLVTDELESQFKRMAAEMVEIRAEFRLYRDDTDRQLFELSAQVRSEKAEKRSVKAENERLRGRVESLEAEVAALRAEAGPRHSP